ncbi:hypothetical protein Tco_1553515 [Tanacetum coccineum]
MKAVRSSSQFSIVPSLSSSSQIFASPDSDRGNIIRRTASFYVSLYLNISQILRGTVLILPSNWFSLTRIKWLPLIANSFAVSRIVIAGPGVGATTRSAAHIGSSSIELGFSRKYVTLSRKCDALGFNKSFLVIHELEAGIFYYNGNFNRVFQRESEFHLATTVQLVRLQDVILRDTREGEEMFKLMELEIESRNDTVRSREIVKDNIDGMGQHLLSVEDPLSTKLRGIEDPLSAKHSRAVKGLSECKASKSNIRRIQVKDIVKEVEDYLKIYSSAGMDISCKEDTAYLCLYFTRYHKDLRAYTPYPEDPILHIHQDKD